MQEVGPVAVVVGNIEGSVAEEDKVVVGTGPVEQDIVDLEVVADSIVVVVVVVVVVLRTAVDMLVVVYIEKHMVV